MIRIAELSSPTLAILLFGWFVLALGAKQLPENSVEIRITDKGFKPTRMKLRANIPGQITFVRQTEKTCATAVVLPDYNIKRELPLNQPITVHLTPAKTGEITFACGMNMLHGEILVQEK